MSLQIPVLNGVVNPPIPQLLNLNPPPPPEPNGKRFVIIHTVDIKKADLNLFRRYSQNVIKYDYNVEGNVIIDNLVFDYLFLDLRNIQARRYYDNNDTTNYNVICFCSFIEMYDAYIESLGATNILSSWPDEAHYKSQFDSALLTIPTDAPNNAICSCINYAGSFLASLKRSVKK
jgi:hypothetical protein